MDSFEFVSKYALYELENRSSVKIKALPSHLGLKSLRGQIDAKLPLCDDKDNKALDQALYI